VAVLFGFRREPETLVCIGHGDRRARHDCARRVANPPVSVPLYTCAVDSRAPQERTEKEAPIADQPFESSYFLTPAARYSGIKVDSAQPNASIPSLSNCERRCGMARDAPFWLPAQLEPIGQWSLVTFTSPSDERLIRISNPVVQGTEWESAAR
jgi:hypothetical protein